LVARSLKPVKTIFIAIIAHVMSRNWDMLSEGGEVMGALEYLFKAALMKKEALVHKVGRITSKRLDETDTPLTVTAQHGLGSLQDRLYRLCS
jgi:hypothetical protein